MWLINEAFAVERPFIEGDRVDRVGVLQYMCAGKFLLLEEANSLVGCVYLEKRGDRMYLGLLSVAAPRQGKGLGRKLMDAAEEFAVREGCIAMDLRVISTRTDIQQFYERFGYSVVGKEEARLRFHAECRSTLSSCPNRSLRGRQHEAPYGFSFTCFL